MVSQTVFSDYLRLCTKRSEVRQRCGRIADCFVATFFDTNKYDLTKKNKNKYDIRHLSLSFYRKMASNALSGSYSSTQTQALAPLHLFPVALPFDSFVLGTGEKSGLPTCPISTCQCCVMAAEKVCRVCAWSRSFRPLIFDRLRCSSQAEMKWQQTAQVTDRFFTSCGAGARLSRTHSNVCFPPRGYFAHTLNGNGSL